MTQGETPRVPADLLSPKAAARLLDIHISTLYRWVLTGRLKSYWRGGCRRLISRADLLALIRPAEAPRPVAFGAQERERLARQRHAQEVLRQAGFRT